MPVERLDLGQTPLLEITCYANLDVRGYQTDETRLESDATSLEVTPTESGVRVESYANCTVRLPENGSLHAFEVSGGLRVKDLLGAVDLESIKGSCYLRRTGPVRLGESFGELRIRETDGDVTVGSVHGSFTMRDVRGAARIESITGDLLLRDIAGPIEVGEVYGDAALRTTFPPDTVSRLGKVTGDAVIRIEGEDGARFILGRGVRTVNPPSKVPVMEEGDSRIVIVGNGRADIVIDQVNALTIKHSGEADTEASFAYSFALGHDISEHLADITAEIEAQSERLEANLSATSDRVRRQVERSLSIARRQVEAAQRRVEQEAARGGRGRVDVSFAFGEEKPPKDPVSEQERLAVLQMLEQGKIDVKQAEELLAALEGRS